MLFRIGTLIVEIEDLVLNDKFAVVRSIESEPNAEYSIGLNKNFYQIKIKSSEFIHKYSFKLRLEAGRFLILDSLHYEQKQTDLHFFNPSTDSVQSKLLEFESIMSPKSSSKCLIKKLEILDSQIKEGLVYYEIDVEIVEI